MNELKHKKKPIFFQHTHTYECVLYNQLILFHIFIKCLFFHFFFSVDLKYKFSFMYSHSIRVNVDSETRAKKFLFFCIFIFIFGCDKKLFIFSVYVFWLYSLVLFLLCETLNCCAYPTFGQDKELNAYITCMSYDHEKYSVFFGR